MITPLACAFVVLLQEPAASQDDFGRLLREHEAGSRALSVLEVGILKADADPNEQWKDADLTRPELQEWVWNAVHVRTRRFTPDVEPPAMLNDTNVRETCTWTGSEWITRNAEKRTCVIDSVPKLTPFNDCLALFNRIAWPSFAGSQSLAESVSRGRVLSRGLEGTSERVVVSQNDQDTMQLAVTYDRDRSAVTEVTLTMLGRKESAEPGLPTAIISYRVLEWRTVDDRAVPWRAIRESTTFKDPSGKATRAQPRVQRIVMSRTSYESMENQEIPASVFARPSLADGDGVGDRMLRIAYTIGDTYVTADGQMFQLEEKVSGLLSPSDLERLLKDPRTRAVDP